MSQQDATAYLSKSRGVHLVCTAPASTPFISAVRSYVEALGLTIFEHATDTTDGLRTLIAYLAAEDNPAQVAVVPVESEPPADGAANSTGSKLDPLTVAAVEVCCAQLSPDRCVPVAQLADPMDTGSLSVDVLKLADSPDARTAFKQRLDAAGCVIAGEKLATDQPSYRFEFPSEWWAVSGEPPVTPSFTEFLVDSTFNRRLTQTKLQAEALERVRERDELDLKYHYVGWKMAENWNALTDDSTYAHEQHRRAVSQQIKSLAAELPKDVSFRYVSLGPGDGKFDVALLPKLDTELIISSCFFVDVSIELLQVATDRVIKELFETSVMPAKHIRAVLGDFEDSLKQLAPVLTGFGDKSFFSLSGFTIGNSTERRLLLSLAAGMQPGDFLLMDARLHNFGDVRAISQEQSAALLEPYSSRAMKKFAFGPVEDLCDYTVRLGDPEVQIEYKPEVGGQLGSDVDNAINVYIDATGMYANTAFRKQVGVKTALPRTKAAWEKERLRLVTLTFYDFDSLSKWIDRTQEFSVRWAEKLNGSGLFLLERLER